MRASQRKVLVKEFLYDKNLKSNIYNNKSEGSYIKFNKKKTYVCIKCDIRNGKLVVITCHILKFSIKIGNRKNDYIEYCYNNKIIFFN